MQHGTHAKAVFEKYDVDGSGSIEPDELEDALFDLG
jgi:Ca2+-binding EF-hand superfamily protein